MSAPDRVTTAHGDPCRIEREIAQGGMATVHLARDGKHNREVALRVLEPELVAVSRVERFVAGIQVTVSRESMP